MKYLVFGLLLLMAVVAVPVPSAAGGGHGGAHGSGHGRCHAGGKPGDKHGAKHGDMAIGSLWWWRHPYGNSFAYGGYLPELDEDPSVYIEEQTVPADTGASNDLYFCPGSEAYYPDVQSCAESWVRVPATPQ
jgi:hypothetical protein